MLCSVIICSFSFATYVYGTCGIILLFVYSEWCHVKIYLMWQRLMLWQQTFSQRTLSTSRSKQFNGGTTRSTIKLLVYEKCSKYLERKYIWSLSKPVLLLESWKDQGVLSIALYVAFSTQGNQSFPLHVHGKPSDGLHVVTLFYVTPVGLEGEMPCSVHVCVCMHECLHACVYSPIMHNTF